MYATYDALCEKQSTTNETTVSTEYNAYSQCSKAVLHLLHSKWGVYVSENTHERMRDSLCIDSPEQ